MESTFGDKLVADIRDYLKQNGLKYLKELNANIIKEIADRRYAHEQSKEKTAKAQARLSGKERGILFDALAAATGCNPKEMPERQARAAAVALAEILKVMPDVTPEEFGARADRYRVKYRDAALTPSSLCNHWAECGPPNGKAAFHPKQEVAVRRPTIIPEPPAGWGARIKDDPEDGMFADRPWVNIMPFYQDRIVKKLATSPQ